MKYTLDQLNVYNPDGKAKSISIIHGLTISTSNTNSDTTGLTGCLYLTTKNQANDPSFSVYVIKQAQTVSTTQPNSTVVILNTELNPDISNYDQPLKTSYVTNINQSPDSDLFFQWDIPASGWTQKDVTNQFFENPIILETFDWNTMKKNFTRQFFDHIEPLQIGVKYWYFTASKPVSMTMESKYVSNLMYTATSVNTTGLIVNDFVFLEHVVNFPLDLTRVRTIGTLISAFPESSTINFVYKDDQSSSRQSFSTEQTHSLFDTYMQASSLTINATALIPGRFFCQYFGVTGDLLPPGTSTPSTPSTVETTMPSTTRISTTPSAAPHEFQLICFIIAFLLVL
ncbi:CUB_2 domain-containing protein [Caenorhabditis elegans]|uniref:CUB_2 domain-containing protein n=1 Tax=Caenorhabditis elegans TaxID=6239 RepID=Q9N4X0_CAEEL|nr:CUB_2 domain-containing protein [Caenorhabditis elegans]CCD69505.1 CUB_2 domain-containing protein [Caenorhabditis elegans]|eukprot:NP_494506.2 Uncharacterized protein CELE_Y46D2A.1 [Caenorhabditis elegans]